MNDLQKAADRLLSGDYTCVLCRDGDVRTTTLRGVKPLVQWLESGTALTGFSAADKVVGKATAFLYVLLDVRAVYAHVISRPALTVLEARHISVQYSTLTDNIINRAGDGICPFEAAVMTIDDPQEALAAIRQKMRELSLTGS